MDARKHKRILGECLAFLKLNGIAVTEQLQTVIEFFFSADRHLSVDDIRRFVEERTLGVSTRVIEHALGLLVEYGFAVEKVFDSATIRYEHLHVGEHHDHFYCVKCGAIAEFYSPAIENAQVEEARASGFHAFSHTMQIRGLCGACFGQAAQTQMPLAMVDSGARFSVVGIAGDPDARSAGSGGRRRLMDLGLAPGTKGEVIVNHGGRLVVLRDGSRIALGRGLSQRVMVNLLD